MFTDCHCTQFRRAANSLTSIYDQELRPIGLKITQFSLLRALERLGSGTYTEVAAEAALDKTTISRSLKLLVDAGWVRVANDEDARFKVASLSKEGTRMLRRAETHWLRAQERVEARMHAFVQGPKHMDLLTELENIQTAGPVSKRKGSA